MRGQYGSEEKVNNMMTHNGDSTVDARPVRQYEFHIFTVLLLT